MVTTETILATIKSTVRGHIPDAEVSLFGSRARNTADPDSDYDILIITNKELSPKEKMPLKTAIRKALLEQDIRTDILIQTSKEIRKKKLLPGHIIRNILKESILL